MDDDQAYRAMDLLVEADAQARVQEAVFFAAAHGCAVWATCSSPGSWTPESNRRPHPYPGTTGNRCADRRFPGSRSTVKAEVIGSLFAKVCAHFRSH